MGDWINFGTDDLPNDPVDIPCPQHSEFRVDNLIGIFPQETDTLGFDQLSFTGHLPQIILIDLLQIVLNGRIELE